MTLPRAAGLLAVCLASTLVSRPAAAQAPGAGLVGFAPGAAARQARVESLLVRTIAADTSRAHSRALSAEAHVAGTPAQDRTADYVLRAMAEYGLDTARVAYRVWLPRHDSTIVEITGPGRQRLVLDEPLIAGHAEDAAAVWPAMNGYSGAGDVTAPVVYVNYGLPADYRTLDSIGVSVRGRVVVARYGRSFRGIKAREAERHGAAALLLYSDPADDGYVRGDVYPDGPMRPADAVQRGSILMRSGDPATPGWAATADARRLPADSIAVPAIPVVPLGYRNAARILEPLRGAAIPQAWQGGLPFRYHVGGDSATLVRVAVWPERGTAAYRTIVNTVATLTGSDFPGELVIAGAHRDSWGTGAVDNVTGVVSMLDAARALGAAARAGLRPRRTVVLATWDAEEWGLIGSTEWVEQQAERLTADAVAYLNQDVSAGGRRFGAGASATLQPLLRAAAAAVPAPGDSGSVLAAWRRDTGTADTAQPSIGDLGGGSDFAPFYNGLGIASASYGFGGPYGVYHSAYDNFDFVRRFADPGFLSHEAAGRLTAVLLARLANADVVPLEPAALGRQLGALAAALVPRADSLLGDSAAVLRPAIAGLRTAADSLAAAGGRFAAARDAALHSGPLDPRRLRAVNALVRGVEQELTRAEGIAGRPWMRNLVFASGRDDGYGNVAFPSVVEPMEDGDAGRAAAEVADLAGRVRAAAARVERATEVLSR